jgi:hypothetical protein
MSGCYASSAPRYYHDHGRRFRLASTAIGVQLMAAELIHAEIRGTKGRYNPDRIHNRLVLFGFARALTRRGELHRGLVRVAASGPLMTPTGLRFALLTRFAYCMAHAPGMLQAMLLGVGSAVAIIRTATPKQVARSRAGTLA